MTTSPSSGSLQTITVGQNGALAFSPDSIVASVGGQVEFIFYPPQHSVVQASFDAPCRPIIDTGFFSGGFTTSSGTNVRSILNALAIQKPRIEVNDYCDRQTALLSQSMTRIRFGSSVASQLTARLVWWESLIHRKFNCSWPLITWLEKNLTSFS